MVTFAASIHIGMSQVNKVVRKCAKMKPIHSVGDITSDAITLIMSDQQGYISGLNKVLEEASRLSESGSFSAASYLLENYLHSHPSVPKALHALGRIRLLQGRPEEAAELLKDALKYGKPPSAVDHASLSRDSTVIQPNGNSDNESGHREYIGEDDLEYLQKREDTVQKARSYFDIADDEASQESPESISASENIEQGSPATQDVKSPEIAVLLERTPDIPSAPQIHHVNKIQTENVNDGPGQSVFADKLAEDSCDLEEDEDSDDVMLAIHDLEQAQLEMEINDEVDRAFKPLHKDDFEDADAGDPVCDDETDVLVAENFAPYVVDRADEYEWDLLDEESAEYDEAPTLVELSEVKTDSKLSRRERAQQQAIALGLAYGWDREGIGILTEVFHTYWWSAAKRSMEREMAFGMVQEELSLAMAVRTIWLEHEEFSMSLSGFPNYSISWPLALQLVRKFCAYPDVVEIEIFLNDTYSDWISTASLTRIYRSFRDYLIAKIAHLPTEMIVSPDAPMYEDYKYQQDDYFAGAYAGLNNPGYRSLEEYGLIPDIWYDPLRISGENADDY